MDTEKIREFVAETWNETDRGYVLMVAEKQCNLLEDMLRKIVVPTVADTLLQGKFAPIGTFSARLEIVRGLGLMRTDDWRNADLTRRIRNRFAHAQHRLTLEDGSIQQQLACLELSEEALGLIQRKAEVIDARLNKEPYRFISAAQILARAKLDYVTGTILSATKYVSSALEFFRIRPDDGWLFLQLQRIDQEIERLAALGARSADQG